MIGRSIPPRHAPRFPTAVYTSPNAPSRSCLDVSLVEGGEPVRVDHEFQVVRADDENLEVRSLIDGLRFSFRTEQANGFDWLILTAAAALDFVALAEGAEHNTRRIACESQACPRSKLAPETRGSSRNPTD